jgi:hypothetical protein
MPPDLKLMGIPLLLLLLSNLRLLSKRRIDRDEFFSGKSGGNESDIIMLFKMEKVTVLVKDG